MAITPGNAGAARRRNNPIRKLLKLWQLARTIDLGDVDRLIALEERLRELEKSQHEVRSILSEARSKMDAVLELPDPKTNLIGILDIRIWVMSSVVVWRKPLFRGAP